MDAVLDLDELPYLVGRAWCLGDDVTAEQILPAVGEPVLRDVNADLAVRLGRGDFIVAGLAFGRGGASSATARALKLAGVGAVIARSFGEDFFRRAIHVGLPALEVEETAAIKTADRLRVDVEGHKVVNLSSGDRYVIRNIYGDALDILRAGGMAEYQAARGATRSVS